jgi:hypothetical protein
MHDTTAPRPGSRRQHPLAMMRDTPAVVRFPDGDHATITTLDGRVELVGHVEGEDLGIGWSASAAVEDGALMAAGGPTEDYTGWDWPEQKRRRIGEQVEAAGIDARGRAMDATVPEGRVADATPSEGVGQTDTLPSQRVALGDDEHATWTWLTSTSR